MSTFLPSRAYGPDVPPTTEGALTTIENPYIIKEILLCNTAGSSATVSLSIVPDASTPVTATTRLVETLSVNAHTTTVLALNTVVNPGESLFGVQGTSNAVVVTISGVYEVQG